MDRPPVGSALAASARGLGHPSALGAALRGLPWMLPERQAIGPELEARLIES